MGYARHLRALLISPLACGGLTGESSTTPDGTTTAGGAPAPTHPNPSPNVPPVLPADASAPTSDAAPPPDPPDAAPPPCVGPDCPFVLFAKADAWSIAVDDTSLYWTTCGDGADLNGAVTKIPKGGGAPTVIASGILCPMRLAVDSMNVYWVSPGSVPAASGSVMKVPIAGGAITVLASSLDNPGAGIAVDASSVYWTNSGYYTSAYLNGSVMKIPIDGGTPTTIASSQSFPGGIAVDSTNVYWANRGDGNHDDSGAVMKAPIGGGAATALAAAQVLPWSVAVDATDAYWTSGNVLQRVPLAGGSATMLGAMAPGGGIGIGIALDATQIYWPNWRAAAAPPPCGGGCVPPGDTALVGVRVAGGSPTLASPWTPGTPGIRSVALDATYAYFTDGISILRATRK